MGSLDGGGRSGRDEERVAVDSVAGTRSLQTCAGSPPTYGNDKVPESSLVFSAVPGARLPALCGFSAGTAAIRHLLCEDLLRFPDRKTAIEHRRDRQQGLRNPRARKILSVYGLG